MKGVPKGLAAHGGRVYSALVSNDSDEARRALAQEAGRLTDRLDELDSIIHGKGVLNLMRFRVGDVFEDLDDAERRVTVTVKFDGVLSEARQQAGALRQIITALSASTGQSALSASLTSSAAPSSPLDDLARRRAARP